MRRIHACAAACPQQCIDVTEIPLVIQQENCPHCGNCMTACPAGRQKEGKQCVRN